MPTLRIEHAVPSFESWKQAFDSDPVDRKGSRVRRYTVGRAVDDRNYVTIDLEFDTVADGEEFLSKMRQVWEGPGAAFMIDPKARIVEHVEVRRL